MNTLIATKLAKASLTPTAEWVAHNDTLVAMEAHLEVARMKNHEIQYSKAPQEFKDACADKLLKLEEERRIHRSNIIAKYKDGELQQTINHFLGK